MMCVVYWDLVEFVKTTIAHIKKYKSEWEFYNELAMEWSAKHGIKKPLYAFLKFMLDKVDPLRYLDYL